MADDPIQYAISSRRHLGRALRLVGTGLAEGRLPLSAKAEELLQQLFREVLGPSADAPTTAPPGTGPPTT